MAKMMMGSLRSGMPPSRSHGTTHGLYRQSNPGQHDLVAVVSHTRGAVLHEHRHTLAPVVRDLVADALVAERPRGQLDQHAGGGAGDLLDRAPRPRRALAVTSRAPAYVSGFWSVRHTMSSGTSTDMASTLRTRSSSRAEDLWVTGPPRFEKRVSVEKPAVSLVPRDGVEPPTRGCSVRVPEGLKVASPQRKLRSVR